MKLLHDTPINGLWLPINQEAEIRFIDCDNTPALLQDLYTCPFKYQTLESPVFKGIQIYIYIFFPGQIM
jgi:hypothetical protein